MFNKILIADRGEVALRIIRTCREMGIKTVAVYSTVDKESLHVRFADEAVCIGPAPSHQSYLNISRIIAAAELTNVQAIHPGYGFLGEHMHFARICEEHGIKLIGPSSATLSKVGNKFAIKAVVQKEGIPVVPGSTVSLISMEEGMHWAQKIGYPIMLKATLGGGGKGIRVVHTSQTFAGAWREAQREAKVALGDSELYIEQFIEAPRHVEVQIMVDSKGQVSQLAERDCSIQRRHQKLVEEAPSSFIKAALRERIEKIAIKVAQCVNYEGVGAVEFLIDKDHNCYFMEMNTRLQVEHAVTEEVMGIDLVRKQISIAAGDPLSSRKYTPQGHAIECRINAEDPLDNFKPSAGTIQHLHLPGGVGVRIDTHIYAGYTVPAHYDSLLAKLIVHAPTREAAIARMKRALEEFVIEGVKTTIPLHLRVMEDKQFRAGNLTTAFLDCYDY